MNISRFQTDKLIVGTNDVSYVAPDTSPTGSAILNGCLDWESISCARI